MRVVLEIDGDRALFIIHDLDPAFHSTALSLGWDRMRGGFGSTSPASSPHLEQAFENFQRYLEPLLLQQAKLAPSPWEQGLIAWLEVVKDEPSIEWWLKGSAALAIRGLPVTPKDIDLVVGEGDESCVDGMMAEWLIQPTIPTPGWVHQSFGRSFPHCCVEWCGGVSEVADSTFESEQGPTAARRLEIVEWQGYAIKVPPPDFALNTARQRGQHERVSTILQALDAR